MYLKCFVQKKINLHVRITVYIAAVFGFASIALMWGIIDQINSLGDLPNLYGDIEAKPGVGLGMNVAGFLLNMLLIAYNFA